MSQMNRGEALRCIQIAKKCLSEGKKAKAQKFLTKSLRMYETKEAQQLLAALSESQSQSPSATPSSANSANRANPSRPTPSPSASTANANASTTGTAASSATATPSSARSSGSSRMSSSDEVQMIRQILRSRDYYGTLGVAKDADEKELKKAYRKKALKCHPDRNKAPGAEEAFKKLSKAYDVLRDPRKKQIYDQYGEDSPQMRQSAHGAQFQQMTPDDIIRMFFGGDLGPGGFGGNGFTFRTNGFQTRHRHHDGGGQAAAGGPIGHLMQLLPIILVFVTMILPSLMTFGGNTSGGGYGGRGQMEGTYFSLERQHPFTMEKRTERYDTVYYVAQQRRGHWGYNRQKSPRMEREVEGAFLRKLLEECDAAKIKEGQRIERIMSNDIDAKERKRLLKKLMRNKRKFETRDSRQCRKLMDYVAEL